MERLTEKYWRNLDPWECCGQDDYCKRGCHEKGGCANGCIVPRLYDRLAAYEDTGLMPEEIKEVQEAMEPIPFGRFRDIMEAERHGLLAISPPNTPLTLEELREMDGEPVWVVELNGYPPHWALIYWHKKRNIVYLTTKSGASICAETFISVGGKIYRRKPEEGAK